MFQYLRLGHIMSLCPGQGVLSSRKVSGQVQVNFEFGFEEGEK